MKHIGKEERQQNTKLENQLKVLEKSLYEDDDDLNKDNCSKNE